MIFALAADDGTLHAFQSEAEAVSYCEGIDVEEGVWLFFAADGSPLDPHFTTPNKKGLISVLSGTYVLRPDPTKHPSLQASLSRVRLVEGQGLASVADVQAILG